MIKDGIKVEAYQVKEYQIVVNLIESYVLYLVITCTISSYL